MKILFTALFYLFFVISYSQDNREYLGAIKLNHNDKSVITYRIVFELNKNKIAGYSITDLGGENETKNSIFGTFDTKTKILEFKEDAILYTKSNFSEKSFCFVNFSGKMKDKETKIEGEFKGLYRNKKKCIDGTITLIGAEKIYKLFDRVNNKIQKTKKIDPPTKNKLNPTKILDSLKVNNLLKNQNLNVFVESEVVSLELFDSEFEDGDKINIFQNDKLILSNYEVVKNKKEIKVILKEGQNKFTIEALNEGAVGFNTASIRIFDNQRVFDLKTSLKKGEKSSITLLKNN